MLNAQLEQRKKRKQRQEQIAKIINLTIINEKSSTITMKIVGSKFMTKAFLKNFITLLIILMIMLSMTRANETANTGIESSVVTAAQSIAPAAGFYANNLNNAQYVNNKIGTATTTQITSNTTIDMNLLFVNKCCLKFEVYKDYECTPVNESDYFQPKFKTYSGEDFMPENYKFITGLPNCKSMQTWSIYDHEGSSDKLVLLSDGILRHYTNSENENPEHMYDEHAEPLDDEYKNPFYYDYDHEHYCIDKAISTKGEERLLLYASVCLHKNDVKWTDTNFLIHKILNPIFHGINLILLLIIAIIYFILPTLRDLVGNMVTTIAVCLMVSQAADIARIFTEFSNHVSFVVADIVMYFSLLGAFFWLNSYAYYIWKMFRSRNVFLRVTDGRKYCYYSIYVWGSTAIIAIMAVFAHFFLDADSYSKVHLVGEQDNIGWLGVAIFFAPIACTIIVDLFFYVTTLKLINRRNVYGRIQHKLKVNFIMYSLMLLIMSICWLFLILSWLQYEGILYANIIVNALQAPLLLYVCVLRQKHITFLLKKSCCYNEPPSTSDWGDELHYMTGNDY